MSMSDPIADMLTRLRNACKAKFNTVDIPNSNIKTEIARILKSEGFIKHYKVIPDDKQGQLRIYVKYDKKDSVITGIQRISKPSRRVYTKSKEIEPVLNGLGIAIYSTSKGIMTDKQAKKENAGGEYLCKVW
ncbi:MAG: 30S ribosomal protein S8 [Candidatus Magnetoglobus multicellularis str. Araruama]|uniref:Small ribosomal subunit protein uS8 n=1 Tax=Candidatus Magnetoglobus multicellularis str. Araruama TaxID=890399 RepID=A0A1V1PHV4_9BACT|nr:MAG: 30S ribosomal protein S8 [Candidatus Magnetoglobus multicellularis str. Araruama]